MTEALTDGLLFACDEAACAKDARFYEALAMDDRWEIIRAILDAAHRRTPAETRNEWQPIETAPKDGSWFLICNAEDDGFQPYEVGRYDPYMTADYVEVEGGLFRKELRSSYDWAGFNNFHRATHWQPAPALPALTEKRPPSNQEGGK